MPSVLNEYVGDGVSRSFNIAMEGGYLSRDYVKFYVRPLDALLDWTPLTNNEVTWTGDFSFTMESAIPVGSVLVVFRETPLTPLVDFQNTSRITEKNLDTATSQSIHIAAEASDTVGRIQVVAQDAKQESAQALADAQAAAASADTAAAAAIAASSAATDAQAAAIQAGADAEGAALSAATAAGVADAAALTANAANATAITAAADAATALTSAGNANTTANSAASQAGTAVSTANTAVSTANAASAAAGNAVTTANSASATASTALTIANEAKDLVDEAVSGAVVSFNGRAGVVVPETGDYSKDMVGLGEVDNTSDLSKPISTATATALSGKVDKVAGKQLSTEDFTSEDKVKLVGVEVGANAYIHPATHLASIVEQDSDHRFVSDAEKAVWGAKQAALVSGINIKTINGGSLLGSGNLSVIRPSYGNKIINGKMEIAQRGTSFSISTVYSYTLDRWIPTGGGTDSVATWTQNSDVPSGSEFQSSLRVAITTADPSIASTQSIGVAQHIEGYNVRDLTGRTFTLSFWVRSSKTGTHCVAFRNSGADRSYVSEYTISSANTWEFKTVTVSGGLITTGAWDWTNGIGLRCSFALAAGSNSQTTPGAWQTGNFAATANQVNCLDTVGNIFAITGVQLEVGEVATPFEHRPYGVELALCQRYYEEIFANWGTSVNASRFHHSVYFRVLKRTSPTATVYADTLAYSKTGVLGSVRNTTNNTNIGVIGIGASLDSAAIGYVSPTTAANMSATVVVSAEL